MITESDLYAMGQESETADRIMRELCNRLDMPYPPKHRQDNTWRDAMADPLLESQS